VGKREISTDFRSDGRTGTAEGGRHTWSKSDRLKRFTIARSLPIMDRDLHVQLLSLSVPSPIRFPFWEWWSPRNPPPFLLTSSWASEYQIQVRCCEEWRWSRESCYETGLLTNSDRQRKAPGPPFFLPDVQERFFLGLQPDRG